jgi:all-trans-8'-apo-beta-carotenal 15,15'-oxygenase
MQALQETAEEMSYSLQDWQQGYESQPQECDYWIDDIEGEIPAGLQGTLFRNGPGLLDIHGIPLRHPFDGDGMIAKITFLADGRAHFRNRYVRTEGYVREQEAGKMLYRGVFGTQRPGGWLNNIFDLKLKNIANTNIIYWGDKLLALWEAAEPYRLDPKTLDTIGLDYLDGILKPGDAFAAHPRFDSSCALDGGSPCLVNFAVKPGLSSQITIFEFNPAGKLLRRHTQTIPGFAFLHDFAITPNYCIFLQNPVTFNPLPYLFGLRGAGECVNFQDNRPTRIVLIPRTPLQEGTRGVKTFDVSAGFSFHHANAFERGDEICLDSICYAALTQINPDASYKEVDFSALAPGQLWRFTMNLKDGTVKRQLLERQCTAASHPQTGFSHWGTPTSFFCTTRVCQRTDFRAETGGN